MKIEKLFVYPIKSCGAVEVKEMMVTSTGPYLDRQWMLVDEENTFITQRTYPQLSQVRVAMDEGEVAVMAPGQEMIDFGLEEVDRSERLLVKVWKDQVHAFEVAKEVSEWFSQFLGKTCKLVRKDPESVRKVSDKYGEGEILFADSMPLLIVSTASMDLLSQKLDKKVSASRFRPNILVRIDEESPHLEDTWNYVDIGDVHLRAAKLCTRCKVVNVNPLTGEFEKEPLHTLSTYRMTDDGVVFGKLFVPEQLGIIRTGQAIEPQ